MADTPRNGDSDNHHISGKINSGSAGTSAARENAMPMANPDPHPNPFYFQPQDVGSKVFKSASVAAAIGTAIGYGLTYVETTTKGKKFTFKPNTWNMLGGLAAGALAGAYFGNKKYTQIQIYNDRVQVINRHDDNPEVQEKILSDMGGVDYDHKRGEAENALLKTSNAAWWGWIISDFGLGTTKWEKKLRSNELSNILAATSALTGLAGYAAKAVNMHEDVAKNRIKLGYAETLALENAQNDKAALPSR